ncbi:MAG TPA: hypothetical protein VEJ87_09515 [Acidimicrobiales bacterium]|nr:hypothetical protein [Acidimicrobiales bacterium]
MKAQQAHPNSHDPSPESREEARPDVDVRELPTDDELEALALSADLTKGLDAEAVPIDVYLHSYAQGAMAALPEWYMAPVMARSRGRLSRVVILSVVAAFLLIEAFGLCSTYGQLPFH